MNFIGPLIVAGLLLASAAPVTAEEFQCTPDQCMERMNSIAQKGNANLVAAKERCDERDGARICFYRSKMGPQITFVSKRGSENVQTIVIVDQFGLSPAGGLHFFSIIEAFDTSLDADSRKKFQRELMLDFANNFQKSGKTQMASGKLKYLLASSSGQKVTVATITHAN